jgi:hemolysin III
MSNSHPIKTKELSPSEIRYERGGAPEEIVSSITHAMGAGMSIVGLIILLVLTGRDPSVWKYISFSIYGATQITLFLASASLHSFAPYPRLRQYLAKLDHAAIYLLIAGTYTPIALTALRGPWGWSIFGIIWALAALGIFSKVFLMKKLPLVVDALYLPMGWLIIVAIKPLTKAVPGGFLVWAVIGGLCYSAGFAFYAWKKLPFSHVVWHLFVLAGSISFFMAFYLYLV